jgi:hypothetical protein
MRWSPPRFSIPPSCRIPIKSGVPEGGLRFIMSLRATGEGHISSIEFRVGIISSGWQITLDARVPLCEPARGRAQSRLPEKRFMIKLHEMGFDDECTASVIGCPALKASPAAN